MELLIFALAMSPVILAGAYGVKRIYDGIGSVATGLYILSLPFYFTTVRIMFRDLQLTAQSMTTVELKTFQFSTFEWISIILTFVLIPVATIVSKRHMRRDSDEE